MMYSGEVRGALMRGIEGHLHTDDQTERMQQLNVVKTAIDHTEALMADRLTHGERLDPSVTLVLQVANQVPYGVPQTLMTGIYDSNEGGQEAQCPQDSVL